MSGFRSGAIVIDTVTGKCWDIAFVNRQGVFLVDSTRDRRMFTWREARTRLRVLAAS